MNIVRVNLFGWHLKSLKMFTLIGDYFPFVIRAVLKAVLKDFVLISNYVILSRALY